MAVRLMGEIKPDQGYWASLQGIAGSDLSLGDKLGMAWGTTKYYARNSDGFQGTAQVAGGALEVAGALALDSSVVGAAVGIPLALHGGDNIGTGLNRILGEGNGQTVTYQAVEAATGSPALAQTVDQVIPLMGGVATAGIIGKGAMVVGDAVGDATLATGRWLAEGEAAAVDASRGFSPMIDGALPEDLASEATVGVEGGTGFASDAKLLEHFEKHGAEFGATSADGYLQVGEDIMQSGQKVEYLYNGEVRTGYVQFMGNSSNGTAKFGFVGTNADGTITTIHVESGNSFWKMLNGFPVDKVIKLAP